ncbi:MAG: dipeptide epimerase [Euryarchaeota archaeon]|nr:dipeptide epimerase [Euryarchaeota archaeon]
MKIESIELRLLELPRRERFVIATGSSDVVRNWLVKVTVDGSTGHGCAAPNSVTRETAEGIETSLLRLRDRLQGHEVDGPTDLSRRMDEALSRASAAKAGLDLAFHDALARGKGQPLAEFLGGKCGPVLTDMTIGIMPLKETVEKARANVSNGFKALKLKVGTSMKDDVARVLAVRATIGESVALRIDANQGYSERKALRFIEAIKGAGVELVEQPVKAAWWNPMARISAASPIPVMADETVRSFEDVERAFDLGISHINVKLAKCGGIHQAQRIAELARERGGKIMVGCMGESGISLAGALHFASAYSDVVRWADLDSQFMLVRDGCRPLDFRDGMLWPKGPGNGAELQS